MARVAREKEKKPWYFTDRRRHNLRVARAVKSRMAQLGREAYIRKYGHPYRKGDKI